MKKNLFKFIGALALTAALSAVVAVIFVVAAQSAVRDSLNSVIRTTADAGGEYFKEQIDSDFLYLEGFDNSLDLSVAAIPDGFYGVGYLDMTSGTRFDYRLSGAAVITRNGGFVNNVEVREADKTVFTIKKIDGTIRLVYSIKAAGTTNEYNIFFMNFDEFAARINNYSFDKVKIINDSGRIVYPKIEDNGHYIADADIKHEFNYITSEGKKIAACAGEVEGYSLRVVGYTSAGFISSFTRGLTSKLIVFVAVLLIIVMAASAFLLYLLVSSDYKSVYKESKAYFIKTDVYGNIVSRDKAFRDSFNIENIYDYALEKEKLSEQLNGGTITLMIADINGEMNYVTCKSSYDGTHYRLIGQNVTETYTELIKARMLLNYDANTGLMKETQLAADFMSAARKAYFESFGIAVIDIVNRDQLRTMFGNDSINKINKIVAQKLTELYTADGVRVYYSTDDLFLLFASNKADSESLAAGLPKNIMLLEQPITINDNNIKLVCRAGINKVSDLGSYSAAYRDAKVALKYARLSKNKTIAIYDRRIMQSAIALYETKESILELIRSDKFNVYYQPQYSLHEKRIIGFEALTRFNSPELKNISVQEFFDAAEANGAIIDMGTAIYEKAMEFAKTIEDWNVTISLNVSPIQILQEGFEEKFLNKYNSLKLKPDSICVEITESFLMTSHSDITNKLLRLKNNGIMIHLDDFGTKYSSLLYLNNLPISAMKIDRDFVRDITNNEYSKTIVNFIITLSTDLKMPCIVEGVENTEQAQIIKELGGDIIQGYYISRAVPASDVVKLLQNPTPNKKTI